MHKNIVHVDLLEEKKAVVEEEEEVAKEEEEEAKKEEGWNKSKANRINQTSQHGHSAWLKPFAMRDNRINKKKKRKQMNIKQTHTYTHICISVHAFH